MGTFSELLAKHRNEFDEFERHYIKRGSESAAITGDNWLERQLEIDQDMSDEWRRLQINQYFELAREGLSQEIALELEQRLQEQELDKRFDYMEREHWTDKTDEPKPDEVKPAKQTPAERMRSIMKPDQDLDQDQER